MVESFEQKSSSRRRDSEQKKQLVEKRAVNDKVRISVGEGLFGQAGATND